MAKSRQHKTRFRLLIYEQMWESWAWPCILLIPASAALWWFAPQLLVPAALRPLTLVPAAAAGLILVYANLARRRAWVECREDHVRIQAPIHPLAISYSRIRSVRAAPLAQLFGISKRSSAPGWLRPYLGRTSVVVDLTSYPLSRRWLRLWFSPYLLSPEGPGIVLVVKDWMTLSRQLDDYRSRWEMRHAAELRQSRGGIY